MAKKTVVIGLDGATWTLLDKVMAAGIMPTLKSLVEQGTRSDLRSTMPPYTAPAWTTFATGVNPGKHGCYDFLLPTDDLEQFDLCNSTHIQRPTFYELLHQAGKRSILINLPNSYPPKLPTPTITDMLTLGDDCIFPADLRQRYPILNQYRLAPNEELQLKGKMKEYIDDVIAVERDHMAAVKTLWDNEPWDLFYYLFSSTDWLSHAMFDQLLAMDAKAMEYFTFLDQQLLWFKEHLPADTNLYILSDHGFKVYHQTFYFNKWLEQEGYLTTKAASAQTFHQGVSKQDEQRQALQKQKRWNVHISSGLMQRLGKLPVIEQFARWFYHKIAKPFLPIKFELDVVIDFSQTTVCFPKGRTMTAIYINDGRKYKQGKPMTDTEYLALRTQVKTQLENLRGPDGKHVTPRVYTKEEIYGQNVPARCPDLFYEFGDYWFVGQFHSNSLFVDELSNKHGPVGMFLGFGPDIKAHHVLPEQQIADTMPTILADLNLPLPPDLDGQVMDIFTSAPNIRYSVPVTPEQQEVQSLLADIAI